MAFLQHYLWLLIIVGIWDLVWRGLALWKAARRKEMYWFVAILVINTAGILPILYLLLTRNSTSK